MPRRSVVYDNFEAGEFGSLGHSAPQHSFTGSNVVRYLDGSIGPRSGLKTITTTGLPVGILDGLGAARSSPTYTNNYYAVVGTAVYGVNEAGGAVSTYTGALAMASASNTFIPEATDTPDTTYVSIVSDKTYKLDHAAQTVTALTNSPGGKSLAIYGDRMVVAGATGAPVNRIYFSAAGDYNNWPARNYIDIGDAAAVNTLVVSRNRLYIAKNYSWYALTGVPGVNDSVRRVLTAPYEFNVGQPYTALLPNGLMAFVPSYEDFPAIFDGTRYRTLRHLSLGTGYTLAAPPTRPLMSIVHSPPRDDIAMFSANQAVVQCNGAWTRHSLGVTVNAAAVSRPAGSVTNGRLLVTDGGASGAAANFWVWKVGDLQRPPIAGQTYESLGDGSSTAPSCTFSFPEWYEPTGADVTVETVIVDFTKYSNGSAQNNHFDVTVSALRRYEQSPQDSVSLKPFDEAAAGGTSGTRQRYQINLGDQGRGAGFQVAVSAVRGCKIHRVTALCDVGSVGGR